MGCIQSSDDIYVNNARRKIINFDELHEKIKYEIVAQIKKQTIK
jgi:hypothetical protein